MRVVQARGEESCQVGPGSKLRSKSRSKRVLKQERAARTRAQLLEAAARVIREKGYAAASVQAIADEAGLSQGAIFFHFGSKEALLMAVAEDAARAMREQYRRALGRGRGTEGLQRLVEEQQRMVTDTPEHGRLHFALMSEALASNAGIERAYARLYTSFRQLGTSWIRREIAEGRLRNDIDQEGMTVAVIAALLGVHLQKELDPDSIDLDAAYDALATILKQGMAPVGAPRPAHRD